MDPPPQLFVTSGQASANIADVYQGGLFTQERVSSYVRLMANARATVAGDPDFLVIASPRSLRARRLPIPSELLSSPRILDVLGRLEALRDFVITDASPIRAERDAAVLGARDGVSVLARARGTRRDDIRNAAKTLLAVHGNLIDGILNPVETRTDSYYGTHVAEPAKHDDAASQMARR